MAQNRVLFNVICDSKYSTFHLPWVHSLHCPNYDTRNVAQLKGQQFLSLTRLKIIQSQCGRQGNKGYLELPKDTKSYQKLPRVT